MAIASEYVDWRNEAYYVAGTRIGLDVIYHEFMQGQSAEEIFKSYDSIPSLGVLYGAIAFILTHPEEIKEYLANQDLRFEEIKRRYLIPPEMLQALENSIPGKSQ